MKHSTRSKSYHSVCTQNIFNSLFVQQNQKTNRRENVRVEENDMNEQSAFSISGIIFQLSCSSHSILLNMKLDLYIVHFLSFVFFTHKIFFPFFAARCCSSSTLESLLFFGELCNAAEKNEKMMRVCWSSVWFSFFCFHSSYNFLFVLSFNFNVNLRFASVKKWVMVHHG